MTKQIIESLVVPGTIMLIALAIFLLTTRKGDK